MDNFHIDITAEGQGSLIKAIEIAFAHNAPGQKVESYRIIEVKPTPYNGINESLSGKTALVMRWTKPEAGDKSGAVALPFKLDAAGAADFARRWLDDFPFGREPDHDGDNGKGWRLFVGSWGHVCGDNYAVFAITPAWAMYGK